MMKLNQCLQHAPGRTASCPPALKNGKPPARSLPVNIRAAAEASQVINSTVSADKIKEFSFAAFSAMPYVLEYLKRPVEEVFPNSMFIEAPLDKDTAGLCCGVDAVCLFVNDNADAKAIKKLAECNVKLICMRCAGFDKVDLKACKEHGIKVVRVPTYSPRSVAEYAVALMFTLNRNIHLAHDRVNTGNYSLAGLRGFEMFGKTVGIIGTGAIGVEACRILNGIGMRVLAHDLYPRKDLEQYNVTYMSLEEMLPQCDIVSLHCPLMPSTRHLINKERIAMMKDNTMLINVSRGGLIDSDAVLDGLESNKIGGLGVDVYENEGSLFFQDWTNMSTETRMKNWDRRFKLLTSYPQTLVTPHSAFFTTEAVNNITQVTIQNCLDFIAGKELVNEVKWKG